MRGVRGLLTAAMTAAMAVTAAGCSTDSAAAPPPGPTPVCEPIEFPPPQTGLHLIGDTAPPVPYSSTPPSSGWHSSGAVPIAVAPPERPLSEPEQVSVLEQGGVAVTYRGLAGSQRRELEQLARDSGGRVAVTPYDRLAPGQVALAAWGAVQRCRGVDPAAVRAFTDYYARPHSGH